MELGGAPFLYILATLMVTFAGFSALLLILRQAAGAPLSSLDRFLTRTVVGNLFVMTAGALLPPLLQLYALPDSWIWRASALLFGVPYLAILLTFPHRRIAATGHPPPPLVQAIFVWVGSASLVAMIADAFADLAHSGAVYITALAFNFFTLALAFVIALEVILTQPVDRN